MTSIFLLEVFIVKISLERDALLAQLQTVSRVASTRSAIQALSGVQLVAPAAGASCARPTWTSACAFRSRPRSSARAPSSCPPGCCSTSCARCRREASRSSCGRPSRTSSSSPATPRSTSGRCAPRTSRRSRSPIRTRPSTFPRGAFVATALKVAGSASRDETRPVLTGILGLGVRARAADGRDRLLPAERQGDDARVAALAQLRGQRAGARAAGARAASPLTPTTRIS